MLYTEPESTLESPESLVNRIIKGDSLAENQLVERYWKSLIYIVGRRTNDADLTQDIAQDTFLVVISKVRNGQLENPSAIGAFIRNIGINLVIAHYRKEARRKTESDENIDIQFPDKTPSIQQAFGDKKLLEIVTQVMAEMPNQRDKDLMYRFFVYGQSKKQICDEFDLTPAHFDRVLHRARTRLKQLILLKTNGNQDMVAISSLLSVTLLIGLSQLSDGGNLFGGSVRDIQHSAHLHNIAVKNRPSNQADSTLFRQETR